MNTRKLQSAIILAASQSLLAVILIRAAERQMAGHLTSTGAMSAWGYVPASELVLRVLNFPVFPFVGLVEALGAKYELAVDWHISLLYVSLIAGLWFFTGYYLELRTLSVREEVAGSRAVRSSLTFYGLVLLVLTAAMLLLGKLPHLVTIAGGVWSGLFLWAGRKPHKHVPRDSSGGGAGERQA